MLRVRSIKQAGKLASGKLGTAFGVFLLAAYCSLLAVSAARAATINAASCSQAAVQTAINSASDGDTVNVPAGSCTYTTVSANAPSVIINKAITVHGQTTCTGARATLSCADSTIITDGTGTGFGEDPFQIGVSGARLTGITITGGAAGDYGALISVCYPYNARLTNMRVDHNHLTLTGSAISTMKGISFNCGSGLVDHNYITTADDGLIINDTDSSDVRAGDYVWRQPLNPGSANCVYVEDNEFNFTTVLDGAWDSYGGARLCFRFNDVKGTNTGSHGLDSGDGRSTLLQEMYNNTFANSGSPIYSWAGSRGGTFYIFNNTVSSSGGSYNILNDIREYRADEDFMPHPGWGYCDGTNPIDGNTSGQYGYPCQDQNGRGSPNASGWGTVEPLYPGYMWGNSWKGRTPTINDVNVNDALNDCIQPPDFVNGCTVQKYQIKNNRDFYMEGGTCSGSTCTSGTGSGPLSARPPNCTPGVAYWATDQGSWNTSGSGGQGVLYQCSAPDTWTLYYTPYTYPHPLVGGGGGGHSACDLNQDNSTNVIDVQLEVNMALGVIPCTGDINKDGVCSVIDVQRVVNAALGGQCDTGP